MIVAPWLHTVLSLRFYEGAGVYDSSLDARERERHGSIDRLLAEQILYRCMAVLHIQISDVR